MQDVLETNISSTDSDKYLTFLIDKQKFGISISDVIEIVGIQPITEVPRFPSYVKGIINLRGQIIHLIDVRLRFHKLEVPYNERTCIIVVNIGDHSAGFIVDEVDEVTDITGDNISAPPHIKGDHAGGYVIGIGKTPGGIILLLDAKKIIDEKELNDIAEFVEA